MVHRSVAFNDRTQHSRPEDASGGGERERERDWVMERQKMKERDAGSSIYV